MIKALIIDDEENSRILLKNLIEKFCDGLEVVGSYDNVNSGLEGIEEHQPDVIFLDIVMKGETGFDLLENLPEKNFDIIFTTAFESYALKAIKFSALDYILKPVSPVDLKNAVAKLKEKQSAATTHHRVSNLLYNSKNNDIATHRIALSYEGGISFIPVQDIMRCEGSGAYTTFYLKNKSKIMVSKNLGEFEDMLTGYNFFRIHNSFIVNLSEIKNYVRGSGGYIVMSDNESVDVSKNKKHAFLERMGIK